ncbi:patatin-like phospholipase family protein [Psychrobacter sp. AH5]|uniref:patatin-like phospholipase family protein n=1 Tax=Psychrobacter sp. AH5 TaxID=2937433 RepID=UPI00333F0C2D
MLHVLKVYRSKLFTSFIKISLFTTISLLASACNSLTPVPPLELSTPATPRVALVLGGGGAKGFAHVGVIKALENNGITPSLVVGTSVGSIIGSVYASGYTAARLEQLALTTADSELMDFTLSNQGFVAGLKLRNFINTQVMQQPIEDFPMRFAAIAAEKNSLTKKVFTNGDAGLAVQASSSVPNIFIAPRIPEKVGKKYIDGGVVSLVPVDSARDLGADIVIAVDVTAPSSKDKNADNFNSALTNISSLSSFWGLLENSFIANANASTNNLANNRSAKMRLERDRADIVIIPEVDHLSSLDSSQRRALIAAGEQAANEQMLAIKQLIADKTQSLYSE